MKRFFILIVCFVALFAIAGCSKKSSNEDFQAATDSALDELKARGYFVLGHDGAFPPLTYLDDDGNAIGYDIDLAKEVCRRMGVEFRDLVLVWSERDLYLANGLVDCFWTGFTITEERKNQYSITNPYLKNSQVMVIPKGATLRSVAGKTIGFQEASTAEDAFINGDINFASIKEMVAFPGIYEALDALSAGTIDIVVMDSVVINAIISDGGDYKIEGLSLADEEYGIAFRKEDESIRNEVQRILNEMQADGTVAKISEKWFGSDVSIIGK